jgi:hypothetical protein
MIKEIKKDIIDCKRELEILEKAKSLIEQSITTEQLNTAKKFMDLFLRDIRSPLIIEELRNLWSEKDKKLTL